MIRKKVVFISSSKIRFSCSLFTLWTVDTVHIVLFVILSVAYQESHLINPSPSRGLLSSKDAITLPTRRLTAATLTIHLKPRTNMPRALNKRIHRSRFKM